jgi:hypothetical protein
LVLSVIVHYTGHDWPIVIVKVNYSNNISRLNRLIIIIELIG